MKTLRPLALCTLLLAVTGCGDSKEDTATDTGEAQAEETGNAPEPDTGTFVPTEGDWTFGTGEWLSDECEATFLSTATGWKLSDANENDFVLDFIFAEAGSLLAAPTCTIDGTDYTCAAVVQEFSIGPGAITLEANARGSFSSEVAATLEVTYDISCTGSSCDGLLSANPCTSVQGFNAFYDG